MIDEARNNDLRVHFASLMDLCHLNNAELKKHQQCKARVVLRSDIVKDDRLLCSVHRRRIVSLTNDGRSNKNIISRLPRCAGQAANAVSAYNQVHTEGAPILLKIPKSECPDIWTRLPRHRWPKSWSSMEDPVVLLDRNLFGHPLAGLSLERQFDKILFEHDREKSS